MATPVKRSRAWFLLRIDDAKDAIDKFRKWFEEVDADEEFKAMIYEILNNKNVQALERFAHAIQETWDHPKDKPQAYLNLYDRYPDYRIGDLVVIRADVVELRDDTQDVFQLVIPVDARADSDLDKFKQYLRMFGSVVEARVTNHFPNASYLANGFVSYEEGHIGRHISPPDIMGLTRTSPGDNPWG